MIDLFVLRVAGSQTRRCSVTSFRFISIAFHSTFVSCFCLTLFRVLFLLFHHPESDMLSRIRLARSCFVLFSVVLFCSQWMFRRRS